ncbi:MAG: PilT/PilU family type 4a pilus ATPase [Deltaproteobacteria bacterium]|nr:PilT/PilU family type 4a pilus ATPase [Deltaproteobacteria bacterium]MBW2419335.1 PilT/PilU family type 4a pilus ATPase [Deltaproteobacteria bacterium]
MEREKLYRLLRLGLEKGASDIHFQVGCLPLYRFHGELVELRYKVLTPKDTEEIVKILIEADPGGQNLEFNERDLAFELPGEGRFRVNISRQRRFYNIVLRVIPLQIAAFEDLNLPSVLRDIAALQRGYVLVTGATGMGKSTTLATMINEVNMHRKAKIVTVEDPIEFVFTHDKSIITQREIGTDTSSFPDALRAALRQDPDVIMVGEMRDLETVDTSLKAAETGHLVFSTIHTSDVASTINRLVSFFPTEEQLQVRARLADNLNAVVSLRLMVNKKQNGRVPAIEVMRSTRSIQECIKDPARTHEITEFIGRGRPEGMQTFDQHLVDLLHANKISLEAALSTATNPVDLQTKLDMEGGNFAVPVEDEEKPEAPFEIEQDGRF